MGSEGAAPEGSVAIIGAGSIGVGWAVVFAGAGIPVAMHDPVGKRLEAAPDELAAVFTRLEQAGLLDEPDAAKALVRFDGNFAGALAGCHHVQECAPESLELKRQLFADLDRVAPADATLASSSSAITCSAFAAELPGRSRCLVAHPANPPYLLAVVELVAAPFTAPETVEQARALFTATGMEPVVLHHEIEGFVYNRLQGALLREAYCLVRDGVVDAEDVDRIVHDGLGRRWSIVGPFETAELNTRGGIEAHAAKLGPAYARMGRERGQDDPWVPELVGRVAESVHRRFPAERWAEAVEWRDRAMMRLERARRDDSDVFSWDPGNPAASRSTRRRPRASRFVVGSPRSAHSCAKRSKFTKIGQMAQIMPLADAVGALIHDGDSVAMEGFTHLIPFAAGHEVIRQGRRDLTLIRLTPDLIYDQMIGMGCVSRLVFSWGGNPGVGSLHRMRDAVERGWPAPLVLDEHSHAGLTARYVAGATGLPFGVLRGYAGTDLVTHNSTLRTVTCPFTGERLAAVAALRPDVAVIHAQQADPEGNVLLWGISGVQKEAVLAADRSLVTVEEVVERFEPVPGGVVLPSWVVTAVALVRGGSHPSYAAGYSVRDNDFYVRWDAISRDRGDFEAWMAEHVLGVRG